MKNAPSIVSSIIKWAITKVLKHIAYLYEIFILENNNLFLL